MINTVVLLSLSPFLVIKTPPFASAALYVYLGTLTTGFLLYSRSLSAALSSASRKTLMPTTSTTLRAATVLLIKTSLSLPLKLSLPHLLSNSTRLPD